MPHVSKNKINEKLMKKMKKDLLFALTRSDNKNFLIQELFTETEFVMLAKRLAIIILTTKGFSRYRISKNLKVSTSTVLRFQEDITLGKYNMIKNLALSKKKEDVKVIKILEKILLAGMPAYAGKGRWAWLNDMDKKR